MGARLGGTKVIVAGANEPSGAERLLCVRPHNLAKALHRRPRPSIVFRRPKNAPRSRALCPRQAEERRVGNRGRVPRLKRLFPGADLGRGHPPRNGEGRLAGSRLADAHDAEGQELALLLAHRDVLAEPEGVVAEAEAFLLRFVLASRLPLEGPGRAAKAARAMDDAARASTARPPRTDARNIRRDGSARPRDRCGRRRSTGR